MEIAVVMIVLGLLAASGMGRLRQLQTTGSVARARAELNFLRRGVLAYRVDQGQYPRMSWGGAPVPGYHPVVDGVLQGDPFGGYGFYSNLTPNLTTPIAYLPAFDIPDAFQCRDPESGYVSNAPPALYNYGAPWASLWLAEHLPPYCGLRPIALEAKLQRADMGGFFLLSIGPRETVTLYWPANPDTAPYDGYFTQYDPTNGLVSSGTIYVSEKYSEPVQRPY